jgi:hypothetical protein
VVLRDESAAQDESGPPDHNHVLEELAKLFSPGGPYYDCKITQLEELAGKVYNRYMTTNAYQQTLSPPSSLSHSDVHNAILQTLQSNSNSNRQAGILASDSNNLAGDQMLGNLVLLMRDMFWYLEFASAIPEGDVGRVLEVTKVSICTKRCVT